ncbi:glycosyl transferase (plasmid) [Clostridium estertheticum]|nr:glycosyl transferase [Clostridium estertheticum]WLC86375.1 glycosyl transferase [Clostridium estertheticum]
MASELVEQGCEVSYILAPGWKEKVLCTGAKFIPYDNYPENLSKSNKEVKSWRAAYDTALRIGSEYDCIIYEMLFFLGENLGERLHKPVVRLFSTFALNKKVIKLFGKTGGLYMTSVFRFRLPYLIISRFICKKFKLKTNDFVHEIVNNGPELNYVYTVKNFQLFSNDFCDKNFRFIGPSITPRNSDVKIPFSEIKNSIIYISLGTLLNNSTSFYKKCFTAFENEDVTVIMSIGNTVSLKKLGRIPDNFKVYSFVPQLEVLQHADLFITHGGMNSVNESMYYGVPMLVVPIGNDQPSVANRIAELGLGERINKRNLSPLSLKKSAHSVLNEIKYNKRIKEFQKLMVISGENNLAAHEIVNYILRE